MFHCHDPEEAIVFGVHCHCGLRVFTHVAFVFYISLDIGGNFMKPLNQPSCTYHHSLENTQM